MKTLIIDLLANFVGLVACAPRFMTIEESRWRKHNGKRKVTKPKCDACEPKDMKQEKVTPLSAPLFIVLKEGEK